MEEVRVMQATKKENIQEGGHHLRIQCSTPIELATFMRKRHLNSDSTAHNSLYHLQKDLDGTSIQIIPLRRTYGGLRCNEKGYIRKGTPLEKGMNTLTTERKRELKFTIKESTLTVTDQPLLGSAQGRIYTKFVSVLFILNVLVLLSSNL